MLPLKMSNVDTDQIMPKQFLKRVERSGYGEFLFYDWKKDPDFSLNKEVSSISSSSTLKILLGKTLNFKDLIAKSCATSGSNEKIYGLNIEYIILFY